MANYALEGPHWAIGQTVTWAADPSVPAFFLNDIADAFADWSSHANIHFQQVASPTAANIVLSEAPLDGPGGMVGETHYTYSGQTLGSAHIEFDNNEGWSPSGTHAVSAQGVGLFPVALHEIGHGGVGLDHYDAVPAIMNTILTPSVTDLTPSDIAGAQAIYGPPAAAAPVVVAAAPEIHHDPYWAFF